MLVDELMAIPRTLGRFPRRGHSRMPAGKRERCGPRGGALVGACGAICRGVGRLSGMDEFGVKKFCAPPRNACC